MKIELKDVAKSLDLPVGTIERWIKQGRIPIKQMGNLCVFDKSALKKWAKSHHLSLVLNEKNDDTKNHDDESVTIDNLSLSMRRGGVLSGVKGKDADSIFREVVKGLDKLTENEKDELAERLLQREELVSTGIGKGIAIPHPRVPMPQLFKHPTILTCFLENKVAFSAIDDQPVSIMFFLLSPSTEIHLHLLSRLSFCLRDNDFSDFLRTYPDSDSLFRKIEALEEQIEKADKR